MLFRVKAEKFEIFFLFFLAACFRAKETDISSDLFVKLFSYVAAVENSLQGPGRGSYSLENREARSRLIGLLVKNSK